MAEYIMVNDDPRAKKIRDGFKLVSIKLKNAETGEVAWTSDGWGDDNVFTTVKEAHLPKKLLTFPAVGREIIFSTQEEIKDFRIEQKFNLGDRTVENWNYKFGFAIPGSENSWETIVEAAGEGNMMPAEMLSGRLFIITSYFSGDLLISRSVIKVFYE